MHLSSDPICRFNRLVFLLAMVLSWAGFPQWRTNSWAQAASPPPATQPVELAQSEAMFNLLDAAAHDMPKITFDSQAVVDQVGSSPEKLFNWVRDNTSWAAYRGKLRGATGVLMDRQGSSLDRSLCLADLLIHAGKIVRLAHSNLDDDAARALLKKVHDLAKPPAEPDRAAAKLDDVLAQYTQKFGVDPVLVRHNIDGILTESSRILETGIQRAADQTAIIQQHIGKPEQTGMPTDFGLAAMKDHWWVQMQADAGWQDMDVTAADAQIGGAGAAAQTTVALDDKSRQFVIDPAEAHQLTIRLISEQFKAGKLTTSTILQRTIWPADIIGKRIAIVHKPVGGELKVDLASTDKARASLISGVMGQHEWVPVIKVGDDPAFKASVNGTGEINQSPALDPNHSLGGAINKVAGAFGDAPPDASPQGSLTAEWIEYETKAPAEEAKIQRRQIFDLVGPDARASGKFGDALTLTDGQKLTRGLAMMSETEVLPQICQLSPEFFFCLSSNRMLANRKPFSDLVNSIPTLTRQKLLAAMPSFKPLPGPLYDLAIARFAMSPVRTDVYIDSINVLSVVRGLSSNAPNTLMGFTAFDIVSNDVAVRPGAAAGIFSTRLRQGIVDTNAEALVLGIRGRENAGDALDKTGDDASWTVIRHNDDPALAKVPGDLKARMISQLDAGNIIFASTADLTQGYWQINPKTGAAMGCGPTGRGADLAEYAFVVGVVVAEVAGIICIFGATMDRDGLTVKDGVVCAITAVTAGVGAGLAIYGFPAATFAFELGVVAAGAGAGAGAGASLNKSIPDQ